MIAHPFAIYSLIWVFSGVLLLFAAKAGAELGWWELPASWLFRPLSLLPGDRICRGCGCWGWNACLHGDGEPCGWVEDDLCSVCAAREDAAAVRAGSGLHMEAGS